MDQNLRNRRKRLMLNEYLMTFEEWQNTLVQNGASLPQDAKQTMTLYEEYVRKYSGGNKPA